MSIKKFYKCDEYSVTGKLITKFWRQAKRAAERAESYAKKYGASGYVQPFEHFEGGVDYLEFAETPDTAVWRKAVTADGIDEYEPNCMVRADVLIIPDARFQPSDTWDKTYSKDKLDWGQAKPKKTRQQWAEIIGYKLTGNDEEDDAKIDERLCDMVFVPFVQYFGDQQTVDKKTVPQALRKAIKAEKDRLALPVVETEALYATLGLQKPEDEEELARFANEAVTPTFFLSGETYYISAPAVCNGDGLHEINEQQYIYNLNGAKRRAGEV